MSLLTCYDSWSLGGAGRWERGTMASAVPERESAKHRLDRDPQPEPIHTVQV